VINSLITNVFIEEKKAAPAGIEDDVSAANNRPFTHEKHTLKWTAVKELKIIFVVCILGCLVRKEYANSGS
jgi:hypothetical protein